jgi:hypothetical protein
MAAADPVNGAPDPGSANGVLSDGELHRRVRELEAELAAARGELTEVRAERDLFKRLVLDALAKDYVPPTEEELRTAVPARPFIDEIIRDLERS